MMRVWAFGFAVLVVFGCESGEVPQRGSQAEPPELVYTVGTPRPEPRVDPPVPAAEVDAPSPYDEEDETEERNLGDELKKALGVPYDCVQDFTASSPTTIRVSVSATVRPAGVIIMPSVYGYGLSAAARSCIERRVSLIALRPLDQKVSERLSTIIEIDYQPAVIVEADPGTPDPVLRNVREPLPKRPDIPPSGRPIQEPTSRWISGGFEGGRPIQEPTSRKVSGPKPRAIDGYEVDENAQNWR